MQKKLGKQTKKVGLGQTPPLVWEKFPRNVVFFLRTFLIALLVSHTWSPAETEIAS